MLARIRVLLHVTVMSDASRSSQANQSFWKRIIPLFLVTFLFCGCARNYIITLNNGSMITATSKPKLKDGRYIYRNTEGRNSYVSAIAIRQIAPASMVKDSNTTFGAKR
jgi:hypothetical protein